MDDSRSRTAWIYPGRARSNFGICLRKLRPCIAPAPCGDSPLPSRPKWPTAAALSALRVPGPDPQRVCQHLTWHKMDTDVLQCSVCLNSYNSSTQRPFDLGCGHSFCEQCIKTSPRSFRYCPECRARASNPHANIALLRLLDAMDNPAAGGTAAGR